MSISSSPLSLSAKPCFISVHRSVKDLVIYSIISRPVPNIKIWRHTWEDCSRLSIECTPLSLVYTSSSPSLLSAKLFSMSAHRSVQDLEIYRITTRAVPISYTRGKLGRAVVGCPLNSHLQVWCVPAPLNHLCQLNFVPCLCIDLFKI